MKQSVSRPHRQNSTNGNRRSNNNSGGPLRSNFASKQNSSVANNGQGEAEKAINDKLIHLVVKSIGKRCIATVSSGARYQGLLLSGDLSSTEQPTSQAPSSLSVIIQNPRLYSKPLIDEKNNLASDSLPEKLIIQSKDLMDLEVQDIDINEVSAPAAPAAAPVSASKFKTDTDISGKSKFKERELQRWVPDDDSKMLSLEDDSGGKWDQFKVNEEKFGVESTYDEHLYTTRINTSAPDYEARLREADKIAREIEGSSTTDRHVLEERGVEVDDSGMDEEDKYSGVDRRGDELMAALRGVNLSTTPASSVSPSTAAQNIENLGKFVLPRHRAAQYHNDPAIISSSATKAAHSKSNETNGNDVKTKPDSIPPKPPVPNESFRLNAQSEINSLREFSANFKIPHKLPQDLLPILSKDKLKQDEILKKQKELALKKEQEAKSLAADQIGAESPSVPPVVTGAKTSNPATPVSSSAEPLTGGSSTGARKIKMDPTKPAFKLNPNAASFTPSTVKSTQLAPAPPTPSYNKSSTNNPSPRTNQQRPYSNHNMNNNNSNNSGPSTSGSSNNKRHQVTAADFFGGSDKIPTKAGQEKKVQEFKRSFNLFFTVKSKHQDKLTPVEFEKIFITPPTWDSNVDESYDKLFPSPGSIKPPTPIIPNNGSMQFIPNQMIGAGGVPGGAAAGGAGMIGGSYPGTPNVGKFAMSPQQHQQQLAAAAMAAHFQQQQFQAAMMYQLQQQQQHQQNQHHHQQFPGGIPQVQPPIPMYGPSGEQFLPPVGYLGPPQGFIGAGSPVNGHMAMGMNHYNNPNMGGNSNKQGGGRKYSHHNQAPPTGPKKGRMNE